MKLTTTTMVSVDGVLQGPGGDEEDRRRGFERGGWALPHFDNESMTAMKDLPARRRVLVRPADLRDLCRLLGNPRWVRDNDLVDSPIAVTLNARPKYVASTTLTDPGWADTTILSSEAAAAVRELRAKPGGELQVPGSGALTRWLLDDDLVDEMTLFTCPVVVGQGTRLFPDTGRDGALELVDSRACPKGITIQVYRPAGRPRYAT
jgi:dihydrofolate reductase